MNTGNTFNTNYAQTNDLSSPVEPLETPPAVEDVEESEDGGSASAEMPEAFPLPTLPPRKTLPLPPTDGYAPAGAGMIAIEQALVTTDQRSGLPMIPSALPGQVERWLGVLRPQTFWLSVSPVIIGTVVAWLEAINGHVHVHPERLLALLVAVLAAHGGANLLNESYDVLRGTDGRQARGSSKVIQRGLLTADIVKRAGLVLLGAGALILVVLTVVTHTWGVLILGGAALVLGYFYSATRYALGYFPLGELIVGFVMGPALLFSSVQLQGVSVSSLAITFALALGALAAAVLLANNLRDLENDRAANKRTLVTFLGAQMGRALYLALVLLPYLLIALVAFQPGKPHGLLLVLLTLPTLLVVITGTLRSETPAASHLVVDQTLRLHLRFSACLLMGYALSIGVVYLLGHIIVNH